MKRSKQTSLTTLWSKKQRSDTPIAFVQQEAATSTTISTPCLPPPPAEPSKDNAITNGPTTIKKRPADSTIETWKNSFKWIFQNDSGKLLCNVCTKAVSEKMSTSNLNQNELSSLKAFVQVGFDNFKKAQERFTSHERGTLHKGAVSFCAALSSKSVVSLLSSNHATEMLTARKNLKKIFSTLRFLAQQGLPIRGDCDEKSNFMSLLKLRAEDDPDLRSWLVRTKYKWLGHATVEEMLGILSQQLQREIVSLLNDCEFYSIIIDETADLAQKEQVSICIRWVNWKLEIQEYFIGFYETAKTDSQTLFNVVKDVLVRFNLPLDKCRGQCYDGAANVSGRLSGLQKRLREVQPRAVFVHCNAHNLNLVVQDAWQNIFELRNCLSVLKDIINFVKGSPKRVAAFSLLQSESETEKKNPNLVSFCPTRWCVRVSSINMFLKNYETLINFMDEVATDEKSEIGAKAHGFHEHLQTFEFYFLLRTISIIFGRVEELNAHLQSKTLSFSSVEVSVKVLMDGLKDQRKVGFNKLWKEVTKQANELNIQEPTLPKKRRATLKLDPQRDTVHVFREPEEKYRALFYEVVDLTMASLTERFDGETRHHLSAMERFAVDKETDADAVVAFYGDDFKCEKLCLHRNMFLDVLETRNLKVSNVCELVKILKDFKGETLLMFREYVKFVMCLLTIPTSTCTAERSFSTLRRIKTTLRTTMTQERLNAVTLLHVYPDSRALDLDVAADEFIGRTTTRRNCFAMK